MLEVSETWGTPPWVVEAEMSQEWWDRWQVYRREKIRQQEKEAKDLERKAAARRRR